MKNDQKNPIYPTALISCMIEQFKATIYVNLNRCHSKCHMCSLNFNLAFKPTPFKSLLAALSQIIAYCHVTFMHHIVALH